MYRQWREVTKAIINGKPPRYKKHKQITEQYLHYARRQLAEDPKVGKAFNANHGIIAMRDGFLKEHGLKGSDIIQQQREEGEVSLADVTKNVVLVPVASIGCGKTTIAVALTKLFGWCHVQNDNIVAKSQKPKKFATQVCNTLAAHPATVADRNNHQKRERKQLLDDVRMMVPEARFVALHYVHDPKPEMLPSIRKITQERVLSRGDNHQTIQAGTKSSGEIINIMEGFLHRFEPVRPNEEPDDGFDEIIDLDVTASSRENLETVVNALHSFYPRLLEEKPSSEELDIAIAAALNDYSPDIKHEIHVKSDKSKAPKNNNHPSNRHGSSAETSAPLTPPKVEYFCIQLPTAEILTTLSKLFNPLPIETSKFYRQLHSTRRIQPSFHLTLMHRASLPQNPDLWTALSAQHASALASSPQDPILGKCRVQLERVVWDQRVMCLVARLLDEAWTTANAVAHVTVGTAETHIKPRESNDLLERWLEKGSGPPTGIGDLEISGPTTILAGPVKAVLGR